MEYVEISAIEVFEALVEKRMNKRDVLCKDKKGKSLTPLDQYREELDALLNKRLFVLMDEAE